MEDGDIVKIDNKPLQAKPKPLYIALNKPRGVVSSCRHQGQRIVLDLVDIQTRIFPVGRLDKESKGLLLLTSDGPLHHQLSHPSFDHEKEYLVTFAKKIEDRELQKLRQGVLIDGQKTRKARIKRLGPAKINIILKEGRNRQIRKMAQAVGHRVSVLERIRFAGISLGNLAPGKWRYLSEEEITSLKEMAFENSLNKRNI